MNEERKFSETEAILAGANPKILDLFSMIATDVLETTSLLVQDVNDQNIEQFKATATKFAELLGKLTDEERTQLQQRIDQYIDTRPDAGQFRKTLPIIQTLSKIFPKIVRS